MAHVGRTFLVECYLPGVTQSDVVDVGERVRRAAEGLVGGERRIAYRGATLVEADEAVFHAFHASDARIVEEACRAAGLAFERVVESIEVAPSTVAAGGVPAEEGRHQS